MIFELARAHGYRRFKMAWHIIRGHHIDSYDFTDSDFPQPFYGYRCATCHEGFGIHILEDA